MSSATTEPMLPVSVSDAGLDAEQVRALLLAEHAAVQVPGGCLRTGVDEDELLVGVGLGELLRRGP